MAQEPRCYRIKELIAGIFFIIIAIFSGHGIDQSNAQSFEYCEDHTVNIDTDLSSFVQGFVLVGVLNENTDEMVTKEIFDNPSTYQLQSFNGCLEVEDGDILTACLISDTGSSICDQQKAYGTATSFALDIDDAYTPQYEYDPYQGNGQDENIYPQYYPKKNDYM
jgi:hypothetical protein